MKKKILGLLFGAVLLAATFTLAACDGLFGPDIIDDGDNGFVAVTSVTISGDTTVEINDEVTYTATVLPETATNSNVTWSVVTGGTATATISSAGVFKATTVGTATIKAVAGGESDTHEITVEDNTPVTPPEPETLSAPANITIDKANYLIKWDAPAGEVKHVELYIDDNSGNRIIEVQELAKTTLNFNLKRAELKKIGRYKIGIRCVHATDSDLDSEYEVTTYDFDTYKSGEGTDMLLKPPNNSPR